MLRETCRRVTDFGWLTFTSQLIPGLLRCAEERAIFEITLNMCAAFLGNNENTAKLFIIKQFSPKLYELPSGFWGKLRNNKT